MPGPSARHQAGIPSGLPTTGFFIALDMHCGVGLGRYPFYPDAYFFDVPNKKLTTYEIEVTHGITARKLEKLRALRDVLAARGWTFVVKLGDSRGNHAEMDFDSGCASAADCRAAITLLGSQP